MKLNKMQAPVPLRILSAWLFAACAWACSASPSPLFPLRTGSIGLPHKGVLVFGVEMPQSGLGYRFLRRNNRHHGLPRLTRVVARAAAEVATLRPGALLVIGDLSTPHGGRLLPHLSHRSGRDIDLVFYLQSLTGKPIAAPEFLSVGADSIAEDEQTHAFYRFDVERQWLLVRSLLRDAESRVQWMFCSRNAEALMLRFAEASGEPAELRAQAASVLLQPEPGGAHDDHLHVRLACDASDLAQGCESSGPARSFWPQTSHAVAPIRSVDTLELVRDLLDPLAPLQPRALAPLQAQQ